MQFWGTFRCQFDINESARTAKTWHTSALIQTMLASINFTMSSNGTIKWKNFQPITAIPNTSTIRVTRVYMLQCRPIKLREFHQNQSCWFLKLGMGRYTWTLPLPKPWNLTTPYPILALPKWGLIPWHTFKIFHCVSRFGSESQLTPCALTTGMLDARSNKNF